MTTKEISDLIHRALSPILPTFPVVVDAMEGNEEIDECAWYNVTPTETLTKDQRDISADLQVAIVCDSYDRALSLTQEAKTALVDNLDRENVGVGGFTTSFEFSQEDMKHIAYLSSLIVY